MTNYNIFYTCEYSKVFKIIFSNQNNVDTLKTILENILLTNLNNIKIINSRVYYDNMEVEDKRGDILVQTENNIININCHNNNFIPARNASYIFNVYKNLYNNNEIYKKNIIQINLIWGLGPEAKERKEYRFLNQDNEPDFIDNFRIYNINMDYYMKAWYDNNIEEITKSKYLIMLGLNNKELDTLPNDDTINKYKQIIREENKNPKFIDIMLEETDKLMQQNTLIETANEELT